MFSRDISLDFIVGHGLSRSICLKRPFTGRRGGLKARWRYNMIQPYNGKVRCTVKKCNKMYQTRRTTCIQMQDRWMRQAELTFLKDFNKEGNKGQTRLHTPSLVMKCNECLRHPVFLLLLMAFDFIVGHVLKGCLFGLYSGPWPLPQHLSEASVHWEKRRPQSQMAIRYIMIQHDTTLQWQSEMYC